MKTGRKGVASSKGFGTAWLIIITIVETIARNGLSATPRARFQIATYLMKGTAWNPAVIALGELQVVFSLAITNASKFLAAYTELAGISFRLLLPVPTRLFRIPRHTQLAERFGSTTPRR